MIKTNQLNTKVRINKRRGFTLIELLIAISILSLLLFTGAYSYSLMSERWNKELGQFSSSAKNAKHLELLQRLLEGVQSFVVVDDKKIHHYFLLAINRAYWRLVARGFLKHNTQ